MNIGNYEEIWQAGYLYINQQKVSRSLCVRTKRSLKLVISNFHQRQRAKDDYNDAFFPDEIVRSRKKRFVDGFVQNYFYTLKLENICDI